MASLEDFNQTPSNVTLDDFKIKGELVPVSNRPSNVNLAAYTAALSENPDSVEANYLRASSELDREGQSRYAKEIANSANAQAAERNKPALISILSDPNISDEEKAAATNTYIDQGSSLYNIRNIVSTEALVEDSGDETVASENARIDFADSIEEVNASHRQRQRMLNQELARTNPSLVEKTVGFMEILFPFAEQEITAQVLEAAREGDTTAWREAYSLMGNAKTTLPEMLRKVPYEQRAELTQIVIDAVNENSSIAYEDGNEFTRVDFLRTGLEENYYGDVEKWIDNIVSVADATLILGPLAQIASRPARALARSVRGSRGSRSLDTPAPPERAPSYAETATDAELRTAEDAAEASAADRRLRAEEDASEVRIQARQSEMRQDPVRRAEDAAEARVEARRAVQGDTPKLRAMEDAAERRTRAVKTGGNAARMTDDELIAVERAYEEEVVRKRYVATDVQPVTLSQNYRNTNPAKARAASQLAAGDETGQAAQALYGTNRMEALVFDYVGSVQRSDGLIQNKVSLPDLAPANRPATSAQRIMDKVNDVGAIHLSPEERMLTIGQVIHDFNNAAGIVTRTEMTVPKAADDVGNTTRIGVTYGPKDNGWSSGKDAVEQVKLALRNYGVKDEDITLLTRAGDDYAPVKVGDAGENGDYLVSVDYPYTFSSSDINNWSDLDVLNNFFDRVPHFTGGRQGSFQRHIVDAHSMLHPTITFGANVAIDRASQMEKVLIELTKSFTDKYNKLGKAGQVAVEKELKRANAQGRSRTDTSLRADGFGDEELATIKDWRQVWDTMYWLENQDLVKTLRNRGFKVMEDVSTDSRLFVKELPRNQATKGTRAYDTQTGEVRPYTSEEIGALYEKGGSIGRLRTKTEIGDEAVEFVVVKNQPGGPYARSLRDSDQILNYREGYYTVFYDAPKFVDRVVRDGSGNVTKRGAVATAKDTASAQRFQKRMQEEAEDGVTFEIRDNRERMRMDSQDYWNIQEAQGRVAQRVRGNRLEDASSPITDPEHSHVLGPVDSLQRSARSVSARVSMRDYFEVTKQRAIQQYGHMFPKNKYGQPEFPDNSSKVNAAEGFRKEAADARTLVEYVNSLEKGYINAIDEGYKYALRVVADAAGNKKLSLAERAANFAAEQGGPISIGRGVAFTLYLALNPLRQFVVQSHQAVQLFSINPRYMRGQLAKDMAALLDAKSGNAFKKWQEDYTGRPRAEIDEMARAYEDSGLSASIDKSNLVRGSLSEIADSTSAGGYRRNVGARVVGKLSQGIAISRKLGFDAGEEVNMMSSWLSHYDMAKRANGGKKLSKTQLDEVTAKARSFTLNMNRAGEMPYNENFLSMVFQFMQVPHKAFLQFTTNRTLNKAQKARLAGFNLVMYGVPAGGVSASWFSDWMPESEEWRKAVTQGFEGMLFNKLASLMYGEDVSIDYSSIAPVDQHGLMEFITNLWSTDLGKMLAESPAGSLVAGPNARITNFGRSVAEYFHFVEPADGNPTTLKETAIEFGKLSSGFSSAMKARVALKTGQKINSAGGITDSDVNSVEAVAAALGFQTTDEANKYWVSNEIYEKRESFDSDVSEWYRLVKQNLAREGITAEERQFNQRILNLAAENFKDTPRAFELVQQRLRYDVENGDDLMYKSVLDVFSWMKPEHSEEIIRTMPVSEEKREQARKTLELMKNYQEEE